MSPDLLTTLSMRGCERIVEKKPAFFLFLLVRARSQHGQHCDQVSLGRWPDAGGIALTRTRPEACSC